MANSSRVWDTLFHRKMLWLLWILLHFQGTSQMEEDPLDVLLTSYRNRREISSKNHKFDHHRHVRECQKILYGNTTFETHSVANKTRHTKPPYVFNSFFKKVKTSKGGNYVNGHIVKISNPFESLSVLEPQKPGGCEGNLRSTVATTAEQMNCRFSVNAGFFNTHTGSCLGNVVSNGKMVRDAKGIQNANFGMLKNGTLVVGYLSEHDVTPGNGVSDYFQLVTGVIWILRNGKLYVNESIKAECQDTEETGTLKKFAEVLSGRTAVGHDKYGQVIIVQVDGKTHKRGVNLYDFGKILQSYGLVNAINLDGGGSTTFVENSTLVNYPSDQCKNFLCARKVSTILCVHDKVCSPPDCNGHGECGGNGQCICKVPWSGPSCSQQGCSGMSCDKANVKEVILPICNSSMSGNCSTSSRNATTKEIIKRFLIKNYAWMDALLAISLIVNFIMLFVTFCGRSSDGRIVVSRRPGKSGREDQMNLLSPNNDDDEL